METSSYIFPKVIHVQYAMRRRARSSPESESSFRTAFPSQDIPETAYLTVPSIPRRRSLSSLPQTAPPSPVQTTQLIVPQQPLSTSEPSISEDNTAVTSASTYSGASLHPSFAPRSFHPSRYPEPIFMSSVYSSSSERSTADSEYSNPPPRTYRLPSLGGMGNRALTQVSN